MNVSERAKLRQMLIQIRAKADELDDLADEILAMVLKKTTQRSPEFRGRANC